MSSSSPTSSSTQSKWMYDVFLSFRGEDTRTTVTLDLYNALVQNGVHTFKDDKEIGRGEEISPSIQRAIEGSRIAIIVFSANYATSRWCLNELVTIMECRRSVGQVVIPLFYYVDPSDVRHQRNSFGRAMEQHQKLYGSAHRLVLGWRRALKEAANLSGFHVSPSSLNCQLQTEQRTRRTRKRKKTEQRTAATDMFRARGEATVQQQQQQHTPFLMGGEATVIKDIVETVLTRLDNAKLFVVDYPVGIDLRLHELINQLLEVRSQDVRIVGIWGMGGIGKTTLAKAIFNEIGYKFERTSFLANIREVSMQDNGLISLQDQLISSIIGTNIMKVPNVERGKDILRQRVRHRKALIVLDDVDNLRQLMALCASREWFRAGSVIVVTTRDVRLLYVMEAKPIYKMREMDESESLDLFSWHAFKQATPSREFIQLSRNVVTYSGGLPLALEVLGSYLFERTIQEWECVLSKLESIPNDEIQAKLRISFDGLEDYMQKDIFLDICCFFINKDRDYVTQILNGCGLHAEIGIQILIERSLIKVNRNNKLGMHDLLRDMGREIIRGNPPEDPEDRSRLWFYKDVLEVLTEHTGTKSVEGIALKLPGISKECLISSLAFEEMKKLRLLQLDYAKLAGDCKYISKKLRWLRWHGFSLKYIPDNLMLENLVAIDFKHSSLQQVWKESQLLDRLKILNLSHSYDLTQTPDFTKLPNLEKLMLKDCPSLSLVHQSIGGLKNLFLVNLKDCKCLRDLPRSIYKLKSLKTLILSGCSMIEKLEEDVEQMESLSILMAENTAITKIPFSLARLKSLGYMSLCGYEGRSRNIFPSIIWSWMSPMNIPQSHSKQSLLSISSMVSSAVQNDNFHGLSPLLGNLSKIRSIWEECRQQFQLNGKIAELLDALFSTDFLKLEAAPIRNTSLILDMEASISLTDSFNSLIIQMGVCGKADILKEGILQGRNYGGFDDSYLPGGQCPDWFMYKGEGCSVTFMVPQVHGWCLKAMVLNIVYSSCKDIMTSQFLINILMINYTKATVEHHKRESVIPEDAEWENIISSIAPADIVEIVLNIGRQHTVKKIIAYLVYDDSKRRKLLK